MVAETEAELRSLRRKSDVERHMQIQTEILSGHETRRLVPDLSPDLAGASYCPDEGLANPLLVTPAYAERAVAAGATLALGTEVLGIERATHGGFFVRTSSGVVQAKRIVNAAGASAAHVAAMVGVAVPIVGRVLHVNVTERWKRLLDGMLIEHAGRRLTLKQTPSGTFLIGGGWPGAVDPATGRQHPRWESLVGNTWVAARVLPPLRQVRVIRTWAGTIPSTADQLPIVGEHPGVKGFYVLHALAGFTLGPVIGRLMAELLRNGKTTLPVEPYAVDKCECQQGG